MTCEALQMVGIAQRADKLPCQPLFALPAHLAPLGLLALALILIFGVRQRAIKLAGRFLGR